MFHSTNGNDFCSVTGSSTASLLCGSTIGSPSDSLAFCLVMLPCLVISSQSGLNSSYAAFQYSASKICSHLPIILSALILVKSFAPYTAYTYLLDHDIPVFHSCGRALEGASECDVCDRMIVHRHGYTDD